MPKHRTNKTIAGYHLLMILSAVDYRIKLEEDLVIRDFLAKEFPFEVDLDNEMSLISALRPEEWEQHFLKYMDDFYADATPEERRDFLRFSLDLVTADKVVTVEENYYLQLLFNHWEGDSEFGTESA